MVRIYRNSQLASAPPKEEEEEEEEHEQTRLSTSKWSKSASQVDSLRPSESWRRQPCS